MKFPGEWKLRWLEAGHPDLRGFEAKVTRHCLLACGESARSISGLTVFDPRDLNSQTFDRWRARYLRPEWADKKFLLYYPENFEHRLAQLLTNEDRERITLRPTSFLHFKLGPDGWMIRSKLRVINVDDSPVLLKLLKHGIESRSTFEVVAQVSDSLKAVETIQKLRPDIVTMDIQMPKKSGVEVVKELLRERYFPVVMVSSLSLEEGSLVFEALQNGAFDYLQKPQAENRDEFIKEIEERLLNAAVGQAPHKTLLSSASPRPKMQMKMKPSNNLIWLLGSSTGGTQALTRVFTSLPHEIPPTLIVQHIPPLFSKAFAESVNDLVPFTVKEAEDGEELTPNKVLIAPGGLQMGLRRLGSKLIVQIKDDPAVNRFKPSVDYLFNQASRIDGPLQMVCGILTGMGRDGAQGLLALRQRGALTFAQDEASSAVFGMPRAAIELGAASRVVSLDLVAETLMTLSVKGMQDIAS